MDCGNLADQVVLSPVALVLRADLLPGACVRSGPWLLREHRLLQLILVQLLTRSEVEVIDYICDIGYTIDAWWAVSVWLRGCLACSTGFVEFKVRWIYFFQVRNCLPLESK